jgi:hypothetical protein
MLLEKERVKAKVMVSGAVQHWNSPAAFRPSPTPPTIGLAEISKRKKRRDLACRKAVGLHPSVTAGRDSLPE